MNNSLWSSINDFKNSADSKEGKRRGQGRKGLSGETSCINRKSAWVAKDSSKVRLKALAGNRKVSTDIGLQQPLVARAGQRFCSYHQCFAQWCLSLPGTRGRGRREPHQCPHIPAPARPVAGRWPQWSGHWEGQRAHRVTQGEELTVTHTPKGVFASKCAIFRFPTPIKDQYIQLQPKELLKVLQQTNFLNADIYLCINEKITRQRKKKTRRSFCYTLSDHILTPPLWILTGWSE